ncbi:MAG: hypothetical protein ACK5XS_09270 [Armatimonadota bacterium]|jgi:hypothetical protein|nr:hypothetical protein [Fimbriimonadaceae bacterium]MCZ8139883.1 hypothetical protein [Fimbriimonadaceae bacterium]
MSNSSPLSPTPEEFAQRNEVMAAIVDAVRAGKTIFLPPYDASLSQPGEEALVTVGIEPNPYGGTVGEFRYQLEGEEDLLHLYIVRRDGEPLTPEEGQLVAGFVWHGVPSALIWLKPGRLTQHFYVGHDDLLGSLTERLG